MPVKLTRAVAVRYDQKNIGALLSRRGSWGDRMSATQLRETIAKLRHEIVAGAPVRSEQVETLREALEEIEALLEADEAEASAGAPILERLSEAEAGFEGSHPKVASALRAVVNALSRLGI